MSSLKIHPGFRRLCLDIAGTKTNRIITAYGTTDSYHPQRGLDQGGVECPLLWRISYEVLLTEVMNAGLGFSFMRHAALREHHHLPALVPAVQDTEVQVSCLAFVDDTDWIASSRENLQAIADIAMEFYGINQIEVNPKKSELL
ncbi:hypothetical protein BGZ75_000585, partial [Mortierella antarctica]